MYRRRLSGCVMAPLAARAGRRGVPPADVGAERGAPGIRCPSRRRSTDLLRLFTVAGLLLLGLLPTARTLPVARALSPAQSRGRDTAPAALPLGWLSYLGIPSAGGPPPSGEADALATDAQGTIFVAGRTPAGFKTSPGAAQPHYGGALSAEGGDAFVAAYSATGRSLWATYLGGKYDDSADGIALDGQGNVYVVGTTSSANFPITLGGANPALGRDTADDDAFSAFLASYTATGQRRWSELLEGSPDTDGSEITFGSSVVVDRQGNVYVAGSTYSSDLPDAIGDRRDSGSPSPGSDGFVARFDSGGRLRWTTYLGGSSVESAESIAVDPQGNVYLTGSTSSSDLPVTPGAAQPNFGGGDAGVAALDSDAFLLSYTAAGQVRFATYLGGKGNDDGQSIAIGPQGTIYVTGDTDSPDFPVTRGAAQPRYVSESNSLGDQNPEAFVAAYTRSGTLRWATYLGGGRDDSGESVAVDTGGNLYVTGDTQSSRFPVTSGAPQPHIGGGPDCFLVSYRGDGRVRWATYLGGGGDDSGEGLALDAQGTLDYVGWTNSTNFPITPGAGQSVPGFGFLGHMIVNAAHPAAFDPVVAPPAGTPHTRYFAQTHHTLAGPFLALWDHLGGIPALGFPLGEPFTLAGQEVQVTERAVLVLTGARATLLPLGPLLTAARSFAAVPAVPTTAALRYFASTGHTLSGQFLAYWEAHQGATLLGAPISQPEAEGLGTTTGGSYLVQWFTNGRLEVHPEVKDPRFQVEQGRVGFEYAQRLGLLYGA